MIMVDSLEHSHVIASVWTGQPIKICMDKVQTPLRGQAAAALQIVDQIWFRHAKAGELCERFDRLYLVQGEQIVDEVPTYRGEGRNFG
jgi:D-serine deaminase-like pyridoxal phosphate-dependent protein